MGAVNNDGRPRVALVHDWLTGMRGGEKVLESIAALFPEAPIYTLFHFKGTVSPALEKHPIQTSFLQSYPGIRRHYRRMLPLFPAAIEEFDFGHYDLVISTSHCVAKGAQPGPDAAHICYCHTPMRYAWDQEHAYFPQRTGFVPRLRSLALTRLRSWDVATADRVDRYIANSTFVAARIERYYRRQAEVIHPPVDTDFFDLGDHEPEGFCLMVSALSPYKRVELAIEACERAGVALKIVGDGPERDRLEAMSGKGTRLLGWVDQEELRDLYRRARCLLQPGVEDFGISSVEALACGCPVVALGSGGVLDIVENGEHGLLFGSDLEIADLDAAIDKLLRISFNKLNLRRRAEDFSAARFEGQLKQEISRQLTGREVF